MESTMVHGISPLELKGMISDAVREIVQAELATLSRQTPAEPDDLLSRQETAELLNVRLLTLRVWERQGVLKAVRIGRRVLYRRSEIDKALKR